MLVLLFVALVAVSTASLAPLFEHDEKIEGEYIVVMKVDKLRMELKVNVLVV